MAQKLDWEWSKAVEMLKADKNLTGLIKVLRKPGDARLRAQAAQALGELDDYKSVESLVRSSLEDPDESVREAAYAALVRLLGSNADNAIANFQVDPTKAGYWIEPMLAGDLLDAGIDTTGKEAVWGVDETKTPTGAASWSQNEVGGLLTILQGNYPDEMRLSAIRALKTCNDVHAVDALAYVTLWGEGDNIRQAAKDALEDLVGENLPQVLQSYQESHPEPEDSDEAEEEDDRFEDEGEDEAENDEDWQENDPDEEEDAEESEVQSQPLLNSFPNTPVLQEEKPLGGALLPILLVILVIVVVLFIMWRK